MNVAVTRTVIESTVLVAGIALGGTAGVGTAVFALGIGSVVHYFIPRLQMSAAQPAMAIAT